MRLTVLAAALLCFSASFSQPAARPAIDSLFQQCNSHTPGFAIAIVKDGQVDYVNGYGMANLEYNIPISPSTIFHLASVSKQFTAFCIYQLAAQGLLKPDDNIKKYLPELNDYEKPITIRQLMQQTSGMRDEVELLGLSGIFEPDAVSLQNTLDIITRQKELNFTPGSKWLYSNSNYILLAEIISRVSGKPFPWYINDKIFLPLGMNHSFINDNAQQTVPMRASSYEQDTAGHYLKKELNYSYYGATNMNSTVEDLAKWLINLGANSLGDATIPARWRKGPF